MFKSTSLLWGMTLTPRLWPSGESHPKPRMFAKALPPVGLEPLSVMW